jgi:hypothetical protein
MSSSLHTLPIELVYRILDHLDNKTIILSCREVSARLNNIIDTYHRYQVILSFIIFIINTGAVEQIDLFIPIASLSETVS